MSDRLNFCQAILGCMNGPLWYVSSQHGKAWSVCQEHLGQCINSLYQRDPDSITVSKWYGASPRTGVGVIHAG